MKNLKSIIWLFVIVVSVIAQLVGDSSDLDKSTVCKNITVHYTDEVPDALAEGIAASIVEADLSDGRTIGVELRPGQGNYLLTIGVVGGQLTDDTRGTFEFFGRIITDRHSPSRPIAIEAVNGSRDKPLAVLHPAPPMGALCFHEGDYLFHSENITKSQAVEFAKALKTTGYFSGDLSLARIDRTDECYVLYACFAGDSETYKTQEFKDQKQANAFIFQSEVFAGASTKVLACELDFARLMAWNGWPMGFSRDKA